MVALSKVLKRLGPKKVKEMDEAAKKGMFGQPEKAAKDEKAKKLSKKEQEDMQKSLDEGKPKKSGLTASEKKAAQAELNAPAKKGRSLEQTEKEYTPAQRKQMEEALKKIGRSAMAKGGAVKKYNVGGMVKCGASNPASGGSKK
jgi:hypothetical protein